MRGSALRPSPTHVVGSTLLDPASAFTREGLPRPEYRQRPIGIFRDLSP
jgi:hypothetical protein